jgi:glycosyltransferase involved in cell wall biosynthesis
MKIMIVTPYFYPYIGGLENYALNIAKGLKAQGHNVFVVTSNHTSKNYSNEKEVQGLRVIRLPVTFKLSNTPINIHWLGQLKNIILEEMPDVIDAHTPVPYISDMVIRAAGRVPVVLTYHSDLVKPKGLSKYLARLYYVLYLGKSLRKASAIVVTSEYYAQRSPFLKRYNNKIRTIPPGINKTKFHPGVDKLWLKKKYPGKKIILFVGNMDKSHAHKGINILLDAIKKASTEVPNIYMVAVGAGNAIPIYQSIAKSLGIANIVDFPGFVSDKLLPKYYAGADVFILPSTTDAEGFGMVIQEAMAHKLPIVTTNVGGIPYVIKNYKRGLVVNPDSVNELSSALISVLSGSSIFQNVSKKEHGLIEMPGWKYSASLTMRVLEESIK